jgi:SHS2 domain-containing protein
MSAAFEQAATALTAVVTPPARVEPRTRVELECRAADPELLLFAWLDRIIGEMGTRRMLFSRFGVEIVGDRLVGWARGEPVDRGRHEPAVEVKGPTMTELRVGPVGPERDEWVAQCIVDV